MIDTGTLDRYFTSYSPNDQEALKKLCMASEGIIIISGNTGSGKLHLAKQLTKALIDSTDDQYPELVNDIDYGLDQITDYENITLGSIEKNDLLNFVTVN